MTDLEQTAIERLKAASDMSLRLFEKPLLITYSGGKDSDVLLHLAEAADRIEAQAKEIEKLRGQNKQLREAAALVAKESAELLERRWIPVEERLPELQGWGASTVVLGLIKSENAPSLNKLYDLTLCVYCDNGIWSMPGRYVAITHWMPLPEPPEVVPGG